MAATVIITRWTGASGSPTTNDITSTTNRASTSDTNAPGTNNPIPVPADASTNYSFWVATRLSATAAATTAINNIKWYTDGSNTMGGGVSLNVSTASTYVQAIGSTGTSGSLLNGTNYGSLSGATSSAFTFTSAALLSVSGSIGSTTGPFGDFVVYQVAVTSAASPGTTTAEQLTWQYDET